MFISVQLKNFRQHEDAKFEFGSGLVAIRGRNEAGKSSLLEAVAFALFGTKALRDSLDSVVTWGKPVKDLKVTLEANLGGRHLTFVRSKNGAEVICEGVPFVTGQNEVSKYAAELLGGDLATCSKLIFAKQGALRGALDEGNKALSELIEDLADFDLFDRLIDRIQHKLVVGAPDVAQSRLKQAEDALATIAIPDKPKGGDRVAKLQAQEIDLRAEEGELKAKVEAFQAWYRANIDQIEARATALREVDELVERRKQAHADVLRLKSEPEVVVLGVEQAKAELEKASRIADMASLYAAWKARPSPANIWEGDADSLDAELTKAREASSDGRVRVANLRGDIRTAQAKIITSVTCPTCGSALKDADAIVARNYTLQEQITKMESEIAAEEKKIREAQTTATLLEEVRRAGEATDRLADALEGVVEVVRDTVPAKLIWVGPTTFDPVDLAAYRKAVQTAEASVLARARQDGAIAAAEERAHQLDCTFIRIPDEVEGKAEREAEQTSNLMRLSVVTGMLQNLASDIRVAKAEQAMAEQAYRAALERKVQLEAEVVKCRDDLANLQFNNTLLKKVRAARPQVADQLWNTVLAAVSQMLTQMRGQQSVVAKSKDGFSVNGVPVTSLSGSALDLLALAIRCSLVRTFLPHVGVAVMDEPSAAMDAERTATMLGFLKVAGFSQVLLVSHEDAVDAVADHLIQL